MIEVDLSGSGVWVQGSQVQGSGFKGSELWVQGFWVKVFTKFEALIRDI